MATIEFSRQSVDDLRQIRHHIAQEDPIAADRVVLRILQSARLFEQFPALGAVWRGGATRALVIPGLPYRVHYQIDGEMVEILTIVHMRRQFPR